MEFLDILKNAQDFGLSAPDAVLLYFLYRIDKSMVVMKTSHEVLTDTLLRMLPGFRRAREEVIGEKAASKGAPS